MTCKLKGYAVISTKRTLKIGEDFGIAYELFQKEQQKQGLDFFPISLQRVNWQ